MGAVESVVPGSPPASYYQSLIRFRVADADVSTEFQPNWRVSLAKNRAFYVRGISWFQETVESTLSRVDRPLDRIKSLIAAEPQWKSTNFNFAAPYAANLQLYRAARKEPLVFDKAVATIILLYQYCLEKGYASSVLHKFSIEPAVHIITSFDTVLLEKIERRNPQYLHALADATMQQTKEVFYRMARQEGTVTYKLARRVQGAIQADFKADQDTIYVGRVNTVGPGKFSALVEKKEGDRVLPGEKIDADDETVLKRVAEIEKETGVILSIPRLYSQREQSGP